MDEYPETTVGADRPLVGRRAQAVLGPVARAVLAVESVVGVLLIATMAVLLIAQVAARNLLPVSLFWAEEVARLTLIWVTMVGVAYAVGRGIHLTVTALTDVLPFRVRVWFQRVSLAFIVAAGVLLCFSSLQLMESIGGIGASSSGIPRSFYFLASVVGYGLSSAQAVLVLLIGPHTATEGPADEPGGLRSGLPPPEGNTT